MAFSTTLVKQGVSGDMKYWIYILTDVQTSNSTFDVDGATVLYMTHANNETDLDEQMGSSFSGITVTVTAATADDDGRVMIWGK